MKLKWYDFVIILIAIVWIIVPDFIPIIDEILITIGLYYRYIKGRIGVK